MTLFLRWIALRNGFFLWMRAFSPAAESRRRMVLTLTLIPASDISDAMSFDEIQRFFKAVRMIDYYVISETCDLLLMATWEIIDRVTL